MFEHLYIKLFYYIERVSIYRLCMKRFYINLAPPRRPTRAPQPLFFKLAALLERCMFEVLVHILLLALTDGAHVYFYSEPTQMRRREEDRVVHRAIDVITLAPLYK